jgi:hypothetical protein
MRRRIGVCAAVLVFAAALGAGAQQWKAYRYPSDGFSASFPADPEVQKKNVDTKSGAVEMRSYMTQSGAAALLVGVCDYGTRIAGTEPKSLLQGAKAGALANSKTHLISEKKIMFGIFEGIEFEAESDAAHISARIYLVGHALYQTVVAVPRGNNYPDTVRFLDSFQLIARVGD